MALKDRDTSNFGVLRRAFMNDDVALVECTDAHTGEYRAVVCIVDRRVGRKVFVPVAAMAHEDPNELWIPPCGTTLGGTH